VVTADTRHNEATLSEMFRVRHELLAVRTVAHQSREVYARMAAFSHGMLPEVNLWVNDLVDHFDRLPQRLRSREGRQPGARLVFRRKDWR
jgi:magnesium transporter